MIPVLFPYTFLGTQTVDRLALFFPTLTVLQPSSRFIPDVVRREAQRGRLSVQVPVDTDTERLAAQLRGHRSWADMLGEKALKGFGPRSEEIPFFEEGSIRRIRLDIQDAVTGGAPSDRDADRMLAARLFLLLAQQFDEQHAEIEEKMRGAQAIEARMLDSLTGSATASRPSDTGPAPYLSFRVDTRLHNWSVLASATRIPLDFWVTPCRAAFDVLVGDRWRPVPVMRLSPDGAEAPPILEPDGEPWRRLHGVAQCSRLDALDIAGDMAGGSEPMDRPGLSIYLFPGVCPLDLLGESMGMPGPTDAVNTLVGVLDG